LTIFTSYKHVYKIPFYLLVLLDIQYYFVTILLSANSQIDVLG
jgi:hypothetical protein